MVLIGTPHPLDSASNRRGCFHVGADDKTIEPSGFVDKLRRSVEAGSTVHSALGLATLALLPDPVLLGIHARVEWNHTELSNLC